MTKNAEGESAMFQSDSYPDGQTKQAFKDSTDINKILVKVQQGETITHLAQHGAIYGDFSDIDDLLTGMARLEKGNQIFAELPGEVRREFHQSPAKFFNYVNDPANVDRLAELIPPLAARGTQLQPGVRTPQNIDRDPVVLANPEPPPADPPAVPPPAGTPPATP